MQPSKRAQLAIFFTVFVDLLGFGIVIPILPLYAKGLALHPAPWMAWVNQSLGLGDPGVFWAGATMVLFSLAQFFAGPILGRISDLVGRRPVLLISLLGTCASYLVLGTAGSIGWVLASRLFGGFTGGSISVAQAAMADSSSPKERSKVLGMIGAAFGLGFVFGPAMAGILSGLDVSHRLLATHGWYLPFLVAAGLSFTAAMLVLVWLPETLNPSTKTHARINRGHAVLRALKRPGMPQILGIALLAMTGFAMMEGTFSLLANTRFGLGEREVGFYLFLPLGLLISVYQGGLVRLVVRFLPERIAQFALEVALRAPDDPHRLGPGHEQHRHRGPGQPAHPSGRAGGAVRRAPGHAGPGPHRRAPGGQPGLRPARLRRPLHVGLGLHLRGPGAGPERDPDRQGRSGRGGLMRPAPDPAGPALKPQSVSAAPPRLEGP
jgi:MFS family permease